MKRVKEWMKGVSEGFTLVELLVVVIIIGILAAIGIPQYTKTIEKARGAEGNSGLGHIQQGEKLYHTEAEEYANCATGTDEINTDLDIHITEKFWTFEINTNEGGSGVDNQGFVAEATRQSGRCKDKLLYVDFCGNFIDHEAQEYCSTDGEDCENCATNPAAGTMWGDCVDGL